MCDKCGKPEHKVNDFVHLHNHSCYSLLDGLSDPKVLATRSAELGFPAMALTDHGSCAGLYKFQKACKEKGIKPILGMESYITNDFRVRDNDLKDNHLLLLAKNSEGLENLFRLSSIAEIEGKYRSKPRIDFDLLSKHSNGLICTTGCCAAEVPMALAKSEDTLAENIFCKYKDLFKEDYYVEIMLHKYYSKKEQENKEKTLARKLYQMAKKHGVKAIATNDVHYATKEQAKYHDILLSMQTGGTIKDPDRFSFDSGDFYIKSIEEMKALFGQAPELLLNTMEIAEKVEDGLIKAGKDLLPVFQVPEGFPSEVAYLKRLIKDGMIKKNLMGSKEYKDRILFEMESIEKCGYTRYFLILWDMINFAKVSGINLGVGRGSAGGSLVLYVLGIVKLDPIKYKLLFERFINPERVSPPDVDLDFDDYRRDEIFDYMARKYGKDFSSKIGTYNSFKAKGVVQYATKALDLGNDWEKTKALREVNPRAEETKDTIRLAMEISKTIEEGPDITIANEYKTNENFKAWMDKFPLLRETAYQIEGKLSSAGVHAAGVVVCKDEIVKHVPLRTGKDGTVCTQFDKHEVEELGMLKFDCLGLKTVSVIHMAVDFIQKRNNIKLDIDALEANDQKVFDLFNGKYSNMDCKGIFQFESPGMMKLLKNVRVDTFNDLAVCNAIYRPGPLGAGVHDLYCDYKHGRKPIAPLHPIMGEVLKETFSCIIFQEDFMKLAQVMAGFTKGQSDSLRKYVGKKQIAELAKQKDAFVSGCVKNNIDSNIAEKVFEQIEYFGGYGFNLAHSAAYSLISYQTAFLKVYYPIEYMCSLLTSIMDDEDKLKSYLSETRRMGIMIKAPNINESQANYAIHDKVLKDGRKLSYLVTPFTAIKGVGEKAVSSIVQNQPYNSFRNFLEKVDSSKVNSKVVTCLIDAGCMDDMWGMARPEMKKEYEVLKKEVAKFKKKLLKGKEDAILDEEFMENLDGGIFG